MNLLWLGLMPGPQAANSDRVCPSPAESSPQPPLAEERAPVPLILEKPEGVVVNFWRERWPHDKTIYLQTAKKTPPQGQSGYAVLGSDTVLTVSQRPLERQESDGNIGAKQYAAEAEVTARKEVALTVCLDATKADVDPGTYLGSVRISGRAIQPVTVPVKMTFQYPAYHWIVPLMADIAFLAGSFLVWASGKKAALASDKNPQRRLWRSLGELPGWIADNYVGVDKLGRSEAPCCL